MALTVGSLFSGIGGLDLGLERAGMEVRWQCEIDPYCRAVLAHHWPGLRIYEDIRDIDAAAERVDLICGGFPCQPVSVAGKGLAQKDPRWLWPEFARVVGLLRPRYVLVENVPGLVRRGLSDVVGDLAAMGHDSEWQIVSAASAGAPHLRERIFVVAYPEGTRGWLDARLLPSSGRWPANVRTESVQPHVWKAQDVGVAASHRDLGKHWEAEPAVGRVADGVPNRVAQLRALGNSVVPQVAEFVGRLIMESHVGD